MAIEPIGEAAVTGPDRLQLLGVVDRRIDLEAVADNAGIGQQAFPVALAVGGHPVDVEALIGGAEAVAFLQDGEPAQARLVDFQHQTFEQHRIVTQGKAILVIMIGSVPGMLGGKIAIACHRLNPTCWRC